MRSENVMVLAFLLILFFGSSCEKDDTKKPVFSYTKIKPSSYFAHDGSLKLNSNNIGLISSIEWTKFGSDFKSFEVNVSNINPGYYYCKIKDTKGVYYHDSFFLASLDTIEPLEYFPAYPGSYWIYSNNDTVRCSDKYNKVPLFSDGLVYPGTQIVPIDSIYVVNTYGVSCFEGNCSTPYKGKGIGIFGYKYLRELKELQITQEQFFCENLDCEFIVSGYRTNVYGWTECKKIVNDTTIIIKNKIYPNTQIIRKVILNGGYGYRNIYLYYFAKDIGIIKCEKAIDFANSIYETEFEIDKYEINKPNK